MKLTDNQCKHTPPPDKGVKQLSDGGGLYLQIDAKGRRYWRIKYTYNQKQHTQHLGIYPAMPLKAARMERDKIKLLLSQGINPKTHQEQQQRAEQKRITNTFEHVARKWHTTKAEKGDWKPAHATRVLRQIELYLIPPLGSQSIADIEPLDILHAIQNVEHTGKIATANKVYDIAHAIFSFAARMKLCPYNAAAELKPELQQAKATPYRHVTDTSELTALLQAIDGYTGSPQVKVLLQLAPLVFARPSELRLLKWADIDFQAACYHKAAHEMKNGIAHIVPLSRQALALLSSLKPVTGHYEYVFHNKAAGNPLSEAAARKALSRIGWLDKVTLHGFRHTASTLLHEQQYSSDWIERQLAHKDPNTTRASYNFAKHLEQRRQMMQEWADFLDSLKA